MAAENAHVQAERAGIESHYEQGFWAGYNNPHAPLPGWWYRKTAAYWTAYERGYWFGRETRLQGV